MPSLVTDPITGDGEYEFETKTGDGSSPQFIVAFGNWDGAIAALEFTPDDGSTWIVVSSSFVITEDYGGNFACPYPLRVKVTEAGVATSLTFKVGEYKPGF